MWFAASFALRVGIKHRQYVKLDVYCLTSR